MHNCKTSGRPLHAAFVVSVILLLLAVCFVAGERVFADSDYDTDHFNVEASIDENHVIHVKETIAVDFNQSEHHGIMRYIPFSSRLYSITGVKVDGWEYSKETEYGANGAYLMLRIGSEYEMLSGEQTFVIHYDLVCVRDDSKEADYLSFDMLPTGWSTPIASAVCTLKLPKSIDWEGLKLYSGLYGEKEDASKFFDVHIDKGTNTITARGRALPQGAGLTASATLPEGYWVDPANRDRGMLWLYFVLLVVPLLAIGMWLRWGRDPQVIKTVEFYAPEGLTPCELGYIVDGRVDDRDLSSMIMYFADKGLLAVEEYKKDKFRITKVKEIDPGEKSFVRHIFEALWKTGDTVDLNAENAEMGEALYNCKDRIADYYSTDNRRLYSRSAEICRYLGEVLMLLPPLLSIVLVCYINYDTFFAVFAVVPLLIQLLGMRMVLKDYDTKEARSFTRNLMRFVIGIAVTIVGLGLAAALIVLVTGKVMPVAALMLVSAAATFFFVVFMRARTKQCAQLMGEILGFRDFIRTAEYDRLKMLTDQNPEYFFNVLPYAYVMGMSTRWVRKFADIDIRPPQWATGYGENWVFTPMWYGNMMQNTAADVADRYHAAMIQDMKSDFGDVAGSIGGGFGGGGFSGGGFGGGGGGAW